MNRVIPIYLLELCLQEILICHAHLQYIGIMCSTFCLDGFVNGNIFIKKSKIL